MSVDKQSKHKPTGSYEVGFARPPEESRFKPGQSGNPAGRPKGRPSFHEILLEEIACLVKVQIGDQVMRVDKERALLRRLIDLSLQGDIKAARLVLGLLDRARAAMELSPDSEAPLTEEELAVLKMMQGQGK
jgi:hypothetical protein